MLSSIRSRIGGLFWGRALAAGGVRTWMHEPVVRRYINESVTGSPDRWPLEWLARRLEGHRFRRALSLGCGSGELERDLATKGICDRIVGIDISVRAVEQAATAAAAARLPGLRYEVGDLNRPILPRGEFEAAFFHQSLHHVERLDDCLAAVASALVPGALVYLDEYVGPSRAEWRRELLAEASALFEQLPAALRRSSRLRLPVDWRDPTEAIASSDILPALGRHFSVRERRDYGGNFFAVIYPHLRLDPLPAAERDALLRWLIGEERRYLAAGGPSFYTVVIASCEAATSGPRTRSG